jgi:hypothetical protein
MSVPVLNAKIAEVRARTLTAAIARVSSPFTLQTQVQDWGGRAWAYDLELTPVQGADGRALSVFFDALAGSFGRFLFADPSIVQTVPGTPVVSGAGQTGDALTISGFPNSTLVLRAGDFLSLGTGLDTRLYRVTANVTSNGSGVASVPIIPRLRASPADGAAVEVVAPKVLLRMSGPVPTSISPAMIHRFAFSAVEAI